MGGATIGYSLARQGFRILYLEKGRANIATGRPQEAPKQPDARLNNGLWPDPALITEDGVARTTFAPLGCGPGGSTLLYAAALERFERIDFEPVGNVAHPTGGWPVSYGEMRPFYEQAEALYRVRGTRDPLGDQIAPCIRRPPPASEQDGLFMRDFAGAGLHPYRLHVGIEYRPGCEECLGFVCPSGCKSDAATICLAPATQEYGATLWTDCEVERLIPSAGRITAVEYRRNGAMHRVSGRAIILAAGTYRSAALLLASACPEWPQGVANGSGLVGRNLMFHSADWIAIWPRRRGSARGPRKTIGSRAFYLHDGERLGSLQSMGISAGYGNVLMFLYDWLDRSPLRHFRFIRPFLRIPAKIAARLFGPATLFATITEDIGKPENRLELDPDDPRRIIVRYRITDELKARSQATRRLLRRHLAGFRMFRLHNRPVNIDYGHPVGTCRFGSDPRNSVLDRNCRTHELANLYVVDGSFMPSSGATNPSLTIAANALRVGEAVGAALRTETL